MEQLMNLREEIVENLKSEERPESLQQELLYEVKSIDKQLGECALFAVKDSDYQLPHVTAGTYPQQFEQQTETLF